ncbi:MAG TPA: hypothetical protein VFZ00_05205, partial [Solirubrobacter sp.]|nr:hypothetical protein [Solirubrobacter sp.]
MTTVPTPEEQLLDVRKNADRMLALLLVLHLPATLGLAALHGTWLAALLVGGGISAGAYVLSRVAPGAFWTRVFISLGLVGYSALFVHQTHGLIEVHFHFFGALAFSLVYRDWRVVVIPAAAIAVHHLTFMLLQNAGVPVWVMPDGHLSLGMVLLHAVFVVFECVVLVILARSMAEETKTTAELRLADAEERAQLAALAEALERRELSVATDDAHGP